MQIIAVWLLTIVTFLFGISFHHIYRPTPAHAAPVEQPIDAPTSEGEATSAPPRPAAKARRRPPAPTRKYGRYPIKSLERRLPGARLARR